MLPRSPWGERPVNQVELLKNPRPAADRVMGVRTRERSVTHIVIHRDAAGAEHHQQFDDLASAVEHVEDLRNTQSVDGRLFELTEVAFEMKPYFKVELGDTNAAAAAAPPPPPAPEPDPVAETSPPAPEPEIVEHHDDPEMLFETLTEPIEAISTMAPSDSSESATVGAANEPRRGLFGR